MSLHCRVTHAPKGCIWTEQILQSVSWLLAFLEEQDANITRVYSFRPLSEEKGRRYSSRGMLVRTAWGPPSRLRVNSESISAFQYRSFLELSPSGCESQQILEALTGLIALRLWSKFWQGQRAKLAIRGTTSAL